MSHYVVGVILEDGLPAEEVDARLQEVLSPFDENKRVPEYKDTCWCVGQQAREEARERADAELGTIDDYRKRFHEMPESKPLIDENASEDEIATHYDKMDAAWKEILKARTDREEELFAVHPLAKSPSPECGFYTKADIGRDWTPEGAVLGGKMLDENNEPMDHEYCYGTGTVKSTYNPDSKWDWWTLGGRWTGIFKPSYSPYKDPANKKVCDICNGKGRRDFPLLSVTDTPEPILSMLGIEEGNSEENRVAAIEAENARRIEAQDEDGLIKCNGCEGSGMRVVFASHFRPIGNDILVEDLLNRYETDPRFGMFAYLDPDGEWHEKGGMLMFASVRNEKEKDDWRNQQIAILNKFRKGYRVYAVDAHI
jgi:hypothetical protein